eukprot:SAG31_NODE_507_length_14746_cov_5.682119_2_plen_209_part_00
MFVIVDAELRRLTQQTASFDIAQLLGRLALDDQHAYGDANASKSTIFGIASSESQGVRNTAKDTVWKRNHTVDVPKDHSVLCPKVQRFCSQAWENATPWRTAFEEQVRAGTLSRTTTAPMTKGGGENVIGQQVFEQPTPHFYCGSLSLRSRSQLWGRRQALAHDYGTLPGPQFGRTEVDKPRTVSRLDQMSVINPRGNATPPASPAFT